MFKIAKPKYKRNTTTIRLIDNLPTRLDQKLIVVAAGLVALNISALMLVWIR